MDSFITFIASSAFGGMVVALINYFFVIPKQKEVAHKAWLKDKKFEAYSDVIELVKSIGLIQDTSDGSFSLFEGLASLSKTQLLLINEDLINEIERFIEDLYRLDKSDENSEVLFSSILKEGSKIIDKLKLDMHLD